MVLRSRGDVGHKAFEQLQLQALRAVVGCFMVVAVSRHLLLPYEGTTMLVVRMVAVIVGAALLKLVKQENAWKYGIGLTVFFKVAVTLRTFATSTTEISVLTTGLSAPHRVMPVMCAIFGGVWYSAAMAVVSLAEMFVLAHVHGQAIQKLAGGAGANLAAILEQLQLTTHSVVVTECFYVVMSTLFGALLVRHYRDVLHKLGQALQARQLFITNMNHEIRTPLMGVLGIADVTLRDRSIAAPLREQLQLIFDSTKALLTTADSILDTSKLQNNMMTMRPAAVEIRKIVLNAVESVCAFAASHGVDYRIVVNPTVPTYIRTDPNHLHQILGNLIGNAFKFSPAGSVSIAIGCDKVNAASQAAARALLQPQPFETAEDDAPSNSPQWTFSTAEVSEMEICAPQTTLSLPDAGDGATWDHVPVLGRLHRHLQREPLDGDSSASATHATPSPSSSSESSPTSPRTERRRRHRLWVKITDHGIGMRAEDMPRVAEPFQQADNSVTRGYGGSGLGLCIAVDLAALLGGTILFASRLGVGSIFVICIPFEQVPSEAPSSSSSAPRVLLHRRVIIRDPSPLMEPDAMPRPITALRTPTATAVAWPTTAPTLVDEAAALVDANWVGPRQRGGRPSELQLAATAAAAAVPADSSAEPALPNRPSPRRPLVLIVDDNQINVIVLQRQLDSLNCAALVARNGQQAVDIVRERLAEGRSPIDAILMDLHMPVLDGLGAAKAIRALEAEHARRLRELGARPVPIITVSADNPANVGVACQEAGMQDYLRKPFALDDLRAVLVQYVGAIAVSTDDDSDAAELAGSTAPTPS